MTPERNHKYYWIGHDLVIRVIIPTRSLLMLDLSIVDVRQHYSTFVSHLLTWKRRDFRNMGSHAMVALIPRVLAHEAHVRYLDGEKMEPREYQYREDVRMLDSKRSSHEIQKRRTNAALSGRALRPT